MEFNFGTLSIAELGNLLSEELNKYGIKEKAELRIFLDKDEFKKVDEDLFYRNRKDEAEEYVPSDGETIINFDMVKMMIFEKKNKISN